MKLVLKKPIAFFDLETTGVNIASDRIVELSFLRINVDGNEDIKTHKINPGIPIPLETSIIHGIYDEHVRDAPRFKDIAKDLQVFLKNCDLGGYNSNKFDIPMLVEEFLRCEIDLNMDGRRMIDVQNIFHQMEQRTLKAAYQFYCKKDIEHAHSAEADIRATYEVLLSQLERYETSEYTDKSGKTYVPVVNDVEALHHFTCIRDCVDYAGRMVYNDKGQEVFNFGKHKGKLVTDIFVQEPSYYDWMMKGDFPLDTKRKLTQIRLRGFGVKN